MKLFLTFFALLAAQAMLAQHSLTIQVSNLKSTKGQMLVLLQDSKKNNIEKKAVTITGNSFSYTIKNLAAGSYAVSLVHDANANNKMDKNFLGIPKESWGISNNSGSKYSEPSFKQKLFTLSNSTSINIKLIHY
jgi:uncharacterized protein (DUF2141 family)